MVFGCQTAQGQEQATAEAPKVLPLEDAWQGLDDIDQQIEALEHQQDQDGIEESEIERLEIEASNLQYARKDFVEQQGLPMFNLLGGPAYTPELGTLVAIGGLYSFSMDRNDQNLQRSNVDAFLVANKGDGDLGYAIRSKHNLFFLGDDIRYTGNLRAGKQSTHFWGVGYDAGKAQDSSDDTLLTQTLLQYQSNLGYRLAEDLYLGPSLSIYYADADEDDLPQSALDDANFQEFKDDPFSLGLGLSLQYDSRDIAVNAWQGHYLNFEYLNFSPDIGSDNDFQKILLDYRTYVSLAHGRVLAFYNALQWSDGDVPYYAMPQVGGMNSMRGIYMGRYRDLNAVEHTLEYRHTFGRGEGQLSKHGMVFWTGMASVSADMDNLYADILVSGGVGYRFEIQPRMNVRVDFGVSEDETGFYFNFTEAF